jgi:muramoyltetrapeptide carboxypeptidase
MSNIKKNTTSWGSSIEQLILDATAEYDIPILFKFPAGHEADNRALIFGRKIQLNVTETSSKVTFE